MGCGLLGVKFVSGSFVGVTVWEISNKAFDIDDKINTFKDSLTNAINALCWDFI